MTSDATPSGANAPTLPARLSTEDVLAAIRALMKEHNPLGCAAAHDTAALYLLAGLVGDAINGGGLPVLTRAIEAGQALVAASRS